MFIRIQRRSLRLIPLGIEPLIQLQPQNQNQHQNQHQQLSRSLNHSHGLLLCRRCCWLRQRTRSRINCG